MRGVTLDQPITMVNIYNFIRKTVYPSGEYVEEELQTVLYEIEEVKKYGFPATYALKYDALMDENYTQLLKDNLDECDEIGCWWEIDQTLAEKASVKWKGQTVVDDHVNKGYSLAYTQEERVKMIDVYMEDFKTTFGYYPKTVGSWVIDIISLKYFKEKYHIEGAAICRDQIRTDGFTLSGGYYNQAYYPSLINEFVPAQTKENQLDLPIFRLLGADPIYAFEDQLRESISGVYTLEPAATIAQNSEWVKWFFERQLTESTIGFSYVQTGQENTYLWDTMSRGYELQMKHLSELEKDYDIRIETLSESAKWYKQKYRLTPVTTLAASQDWNLAQNLKTLWYNSRFYRTSFLFEKGTLIIRDLHLFNEAYPSRYYDHVLVEEESVFDTLPILDAHRYSSQHKRAKIEFLQLDDGNQTTRLKGDNITFEKINDHHYQMLWALNDGSYVAIHCKENSMVIELEPNQQETKLMIALNECPVLKERTFDRLNFTHENFDYGICVKQGEIQERDDYAFAIMAEQNRIELQLSLINLESEAEFLSDCYHLHQNEIDQYIPNHKRNPAQKQSMKRANKPNISPKISLKKVNEMETFIIENPNLEGDIYYTLDGSTPSKNSYLYQGPIELNHEATIKAKVFIEGMKDSLEEEASLYQSRPISNITAITNPVDIKQYNPKGVKTLIDGEKGTKNYRDGHWLGYHDDFEVIVDLGEKTLLHKITVGFLQDTRAWIYYPKDLLVLGSNDGCTFENIHYLDLDCEVPRKEIAVENIQIKKEMNYRYLKILAHNQKICPPWSILPGEGPTFLFVDQISIV